MLTKLAIKFCSFFHPIGKKIYKLVKYNAYIRLGFSIM